MKSERLYNVWKGMLYRCESVNCAEYRSYGGRGISVCDEWHDFDAFEKWAFDTGYDPNAKKGECTIDRIDVDGNYEPGNCRWVSMDVQRKNKRKNRNVKKKMRFPNLEAELVRFGYDEIDVAKRLGVSHQEAIELIRGDAEVTLRQANALSYMLGNLSVSYLFDYRPKIPNL